MVWGLSIWCKDKSCVNKEQSLVWVYILRWEIGNKMYVAIYFGESFALR